MKVIGVDIGAQKTMLVADDADIVLTDTGSISRPTLVSFQGRSRLVGEEAAPQISSDSTISLLNLLTGKNEVVKDDLHAHRRFNLTSSSSGLIVEVSYCDNKESFSVTSILAMFISNLYKRAVAVYGEDIALSFALCPNYELSIPRAIKEACEIVDINESKISFVDATDCIVSTYHRKLQALRGAEKQTLENKKTILIEVGHSKTTVVVTDISLQNDQLTPTKLGSTVDSNLGAFHYDLSLFQYFADICQKTYKTEVTPGSKKGQRLLLACERARKLLSQLSEAKITVENLTDNGDVNFTVKRDDFANINAPLISKFKSLISDVLTKCNITPSDISAVEIVGGGSRMPILQQVIIAMFGESIPLGAKFDDASVALGAALNTLKTLNTATGNDANTTENTVVYATSLSSMDGYSTTIGLSVTELTQAKTREQEMQKQDAELKQILKARNDMESYILEMKSTKRHKHANKIKDLTKLETILTDCETWLWDNIDINEIQIINEQFEQLKTQVNALCGEYFECIEKDRVAVEKALEVEASKAEAEKNNNEDGENADDHDNRKLRKPERMRMVIKNKEEGTELFKGGNYRPAAARYHKALTHCAKFFDLTSEDEKEVTQIKTTLYLNIASCYLKMENWDQAIRNCNDALELEANNIKAFFRRACGYEGKKEFDKALVDLKKCQELNDVEDKAVTKMVDKIKKDISKEKDKEKKMWGKAFA